MRRFDSMAANKQRYNRAKSGGRPSADSDAAAAEGAAAVAAAPHSGTPTRTAARTRFAEPEHSPVISVSSESTGESDVSRQRRGLLIYAP